ncbi:hypothetical protein [Asticcacaulis benevestitus]|uniref:Uncharacterized protein n=1 Tax=Asticcacaulis benevestitus DSM 16100 = ATCC BAA-896 TaxID=1121022 RepID=V4P658_9CAUL|nr:hypothetical protein [Asticcacaulis benevestitus]ESQ89447.1 hypothetical protein ABENE_13795 [Asticcacaulis benevestitus DSM 16100 = ATCC BAA-896]
MALEKRSPSHSDEFLAQKPASSPVLQDVTKAANLSGDATVAVHDLQSSIDRAFSFSPRSTSEVEPLAFVAGIGGAVLFSGMAWIGLAKAFTLLLG